jgi:mono/diheme cytochrome c family protein
MRQAAGTVAASIALLAAGGTAAGAPDPVAKGAEIYGRKECAGCHERGEARPLEGLSQRYDRESLTLLLSNAPPGMPRFELSDDELRSLARFLLATFP